jgi:predicted dinucleotide-binding enzyme
VDYGNALDCKTIIDIANPVATDLSSPVTPHGSSGVRSPGSSASASVVKAFNAIFGPVLAKGGQLDVFIAADDAEAKARA